MQSSWSDHHFPTAVKLATCLVLAWASFWRRFRLNARPMLTVIVVAAVILVCRELVVRNQREAVSAIEQAGGSVSYEWEWRNGRPLPVASPARWPKWLIRALGPDLFGHVL